MLQLKQLNPGNRSEWLVEKRYTFGSSEDCSYVVSGQGISAIHAGLEVDGDKLQLVNLIGGDHVLLNGEVLEKHVQLKPGDEFSIGDTLFKIEDPKQNRKTTKTLDPGLVSWTLKAKNTALANKSFPLAGSQTIGRSKDCDICLNVVHLSRRHAQITIKDDYLQIDDLNSSNGTFVNGRKVDTAKLRSGDEIGFDTLKFLVIGPTPSLEKTAVRRAPADVDATTMRPMIKESDLVSHQQKPVTKSKNTEAVASEPRPQIAKTQETKPPSETKVGLFMIVLILMAIAGAAAYIFLG